MANLAILRVIIILKIFGIYTSGRETRKRVLKNGNASRNRQRNWQQLIYPPTLHPLRISNTGKTLKPSSIRKLGTTNYR